MKEYISQRLMVLVLVLSGMGGLIAAAKWGLLDSQATAALIGGLIGSIRSLIEPHGDGTSRVPPAVTGGAAGAAIALVISCMMSCTPGEQQLAAKSLHMGSDVCRAVAVAANRPDVEQVCGLAHDGSEVLAQALMLQACGLPDGGE